MLSYHFANIFEIFRCCIIFACYIAHLLLL